MKDLLPSVNGAKSAAFFLAVVSIFTQASCTSIVKSIKAGKPSSVASPIADQQQQKILAKIFAPGSPRTDTEKQAHDLLVTEDFATIDRLANDARIKKQRIVGGYWKLDAIYEGLSSFYAEYQGQAINGEMWANRIELLKQWKQKTPESITARIALGEGYINQGWFARGSGYADSVPGESRTFLAERLDLAERELADAQELKVKCPRWYREMLYLGMVEGWETDRFENIFDDAIAFEPNYLQAYLVKSENLTPKWNGENGGWLKFVDALPGKLATIKSDEADLIYFIVVVNKITDPTLSINWNMIAKDRIKHGFAQLEQKYGADNLRLNQYALSAFLTQDYTSANHAFSRIGNNFNNDVWGESTFRSFREIASKKGS